MFVSGFLFLQFKAKCYVYSVVQFYLSTAFLKNRLGCRNSFQVDFLILQACRVSTICFCAVTILASSFSNMTITELNIKFEKPVYYPGDMINGCVTVILDRPKRINGIELTIKGRTKLKWTRVENHRNRDRDSWETRSITHAGKECYLKSVSKLVGSKSDLSVGAHTYQFAAVLPLNVPSTFNTKYGGIAYYAKVKVDVPLQPDRIVKKFLHVENPLDLNHFPRLKNSAKLENSKTFCCFCCASGPLAMVTYIPKTGYAETEPIPITVEIDNASNVRVNNVAIKLMRNIIWVAASDRKMEKVEMKNLTLGEVVEHSSKTWSQSMLLDCGPFKNVTHCNIISIQYSLEVVADPSGAHTDLVIEIPLVIGSIPFHEREAVSAPNTGQLLVTQNFPQQVNVPMPYSQNVPQSNSMVNVDKAMPASHPYASAPHSSAFDGYSQGFFDSSAQSTPPVPFFAPYPSSHHMPATFDGRQPNIGGPVANNPAAGGFPVANLNPSAPPILNLAASFPRVANASSSGFHDPSAVQFG